MGGGLKDGVREVSMVQIEDTRKKQIRSRSSVLEKMGRRFRGQVVGWIQAREANLFPLISEERIRARVHQVWAPVQQPQYHSSLLEMQLSSSTPDLLCQKLKEGGSNLCFNKPSR